MNNKLIPENPFFDPRHEIEHDPAMRALYSLMLSIQLFANRDEYAAQLLAEVSKQHTQFMAEAQDTEAILKTTLCLQVVDETNDAALKEIEEELL